MNRLHRRGFLTTLAGLATSSAGLPLVSSACRLPALMTARRIPRIGHLRYGPPELLADRVEAFRQGLSDLGYIEGQTIAIEWRVTLSDLQESGAELAAELVRLGVDVIVAEGAAAAEAARNATHTIPIVVANSSMTIEAFKSGFVGNMSHPDRNITGILGAVSGLTTKQLELLRGVVPGLARVAMFVLPSSLGNLEAWDESQHAASALGFEVKRVDFSSVEEMEAVFASGVLDDVQATHGGGYNVLGPVRERFAELLIQHRLAAIHNTRDLVDAGMLMSYGPKGGVLVQSRSAATYVDKILKGAKPADLPVQQPTEFDFVVNLKTAQALGLTIPRDVAVQVTEWIQ